MRAWVLGCLAAAVATGAYAQTIDTNEEAWAIAARNNITPDKWALVSADTNSATFIMRPQTDRLEMSRWIVSIYTEALTAEFAYMSANCAAGDFVFTQSDIRDWHGESRGSNGASARERPVPGSVGEDIMGMLCPPIIVPGPPAITLPIEPTKKEDRVYYQPRT